MLAEMPVTDIPAFDLASIQPFYGDYAGPTDRRDSEILVAEAEARGEQVQRLERSRAKLVKYLDYHFQRIKNVTEIIKMPQPGEQYRLVTQKGFNTFTFIAYLVKMFRRIDHLDVITFNVNEGTIMALMALLDADQVGTLRVVISDSVKFRMPKRVDQLRREFANRQNSGRFDVAFCWNHAKIALASIGDNRFIVEGSGNFSSNAEIEQYVFENSRDVYDWHRSWISDALFNDAKKGVRTELLGECRGNRP